MTARRGGLRAVADVPRRGLALIRVSKVGDRGDDLTSPEIQRVRIEEYAAAQGITVVEWVEALDESASRARSPWWARLDAAVAQVEAGTVDVILVWKLSRAARHRRRWAVALDRVEVAGGSIESATEQIDTGTSTGRLARGMLAELAAWESDVKSEVWRETGDRRRRAGMAHTNYPRLGYRRDGDVYVVDEDTAPLVVESYRRYVAGDGAAQLAEWLNRLGVRQPRSGGRWTPKTVLRMLDSGFAAGLLRVGDDWVPGAQPVLVDERTWRRFRRVRVARADTPSRLVAPVTALSGLMRCGACRRSMRVKRLPPHRDGRPRRAIYACSTFGCERPSYVSVRRATEAVLAWLRPLVDDVDVSQAARVSDAAAKAAARADRRQLQRQVERLDTALARLTVDLASGLVLPAEYRAARDELVEQRRVAAATLDGLEDVVGRPAPARREVRRLLEHWDAFDDTARNRQLRVLVREVIVERPEVRGGRAVVRPFAVWE